MGYPAEIMQGIDLDSPFRCQCRAERSDQCARFATQEDAMCDHCRGRDHGRRFDLVFAVPAEVVERYPRSAVERLLASNRGHVHVATFGEEGARRWCASLLGMLPARLGQ